MDLRRRPSPTPSGWPAVCVAGGARAGDRVVVMAANSSRFVLTWLGCGLGGLVEVPVNTAYEGEFLRHQVALVEARWAVIDDVHAERFVALRDALPALEGFWVIDTGRLEGALAALRGRRLVGGSPGTTSRTPTGCSFPSRRRTRSRLGLLHLGHDRAVQGRRDAALADVLLRPRGRLVHPADRVTTPT